MATQSPGEGTALTFAPTSLAHLSDRVLDDPALNTRESLLQMAREFVRNGMPSPPTEPSDDGM